MPTPIHPTRRYKGVVQEIDVLQLAEHGAWLRRLKLEQADGQAVELKHLWLSSYFKDYFTVGTEEEIEVLETDLYPVYVLGGQVEAAGKDSLQGLLVGIVEQGEWLYPEADLRELVVRADLLEGQTRQSLALHMGLAFGLSFIGFSVFNGLDGLVSVLTNLLYAALLALLFGLFTRLVYSGSGARSFVRISRQLENDYLGSGPGPSPTD